VIEREAANEKAQRVREKLMLSHLHDIEREMVLT
jgi:hypothetical protein